MLDFLNACCEIQLNCCVLWHPPETVVLREVQAVTTGIPDGPSEIISVAEHVTVQED